MKIIILIFTRVLCLCLGQTIFNEELYHSALDEELCTRQLENMDEFEFYDSSFRMPQGLSEGNLESYGNFHQCLGINQDFDGENIQGKYCLIRSRLTTPTFRIPVLGGVSELNGLTWMDLAFNMSRNDMLQMQTQTPEALLSSMANSTNPVVATVELRLGLCVPKTCTVDAVLRPYVEHPLIQFNYSEDFCRLPGDKPFLGPDYIGLVIFSIIGILTLMCTAYELRHVVIYDKDPGKASELRRTFSIYSNTNRLLSFDKKTRSLDCLNGIRALSVMWIIIFHAACILAINTSINKLEVRRTPSNIWEWPSDSKISGHVLYGLDNKGVFQIYVTTLAAAIYLMTNAINTKKYMLWVFIGELTVDSFFALSGLLLVYTFVYKNKELTWRSLPEFYWNRYMRLFPLLAATVLLQSAAMHRLVDGPRAMYVINEVGKCRTYWWSTLLHLQNIFNPTVMCLDHLWYLSVDMQLYIVSPLVLCWLLRSPRAAWTALAAAVVASLAGSLAFCFYFNFNKPDVGKEDFTYRVWYYQNTVTRSPPFFIGMLFGYILHVYRRENLKFPKWSIFVCYSIALVLFSVAVFGQPTPSHEKQIGVNIHMALFRSCWALALCWLILACAHGYGGPVNWFLSLKPWQIVARISYGMYLFSFMIQLTIFASGAQYYFNTQTLLSQFAADLTYTLALSVAGSVLVESPVATLVKLLQNRTHNVMLTASDQTTLGKHVGKSIVTKF